MTRQRNVLLSLLRRMRSHPTADELYLKLRNRLPRISMGTVYRNLQSLCDQGLVSEIATAGRQRRYAAGLEDHYHVRCLKCGRVADCPSRPPAELETAAGRACNFQITGHRLEFLGLCPRCTPRRGRQSPRTAPGRHGRDPGSPDMETYDDA